ncbi:nitroreductase/quinone reductase family protein [Kitasatospora sp. A2-31]|uniref:nitroreductase/quinone reductase family protein n=1 Tax=Kitasatospora sp. A2-31 TaxID=2916414 RepID=UPI001EEA7C2D|nr:nitroreductase/quinone reductase family protein [Kitasatospora sp. A2-31]MCG6496011.1 nitroreductase/quinone reductase family protein [Kitasatospora sp. A2-31]
MPMSFNQAVIEEFRANGGKVGGPFEGGDLLLLTTTGARSGREHTVPLGYVRAEGLLLVVASAAGAPEHPQWYRNLLAHPVVRVELGTEVFASVAVPAEGARRDRLFEAVVRVAPGYGDYQAHSERVLPVVALEQAVAEAEPRAVADLADKVVQVHTWLRAQLRHVREETEAHFASGAAGDGRPPGLGFQVRQHCLAFCEGLTHHHTGEDSAIFPALARSHPELRPALERLGEQHREVGRIRDRLVALLSGIGVADPARFRAELALMSAELEAHLDQEEAELLPVLAGIPFPPRR